MHLCGPCEALKSQDAERKAAPGLPLEAWCAECTHVGGARVRLADASHGLCGRCAERRRECQACGASTLSGAEQASREAFETLFDAFTTLVKTFGIRRSRELLKAEVGFTPEEAEHVPALLALDLGAVDATQPSEPYHYRRKRPIWTHVHGTLSLTSAPPHCGGCRIPRHPAAMTRAERCGHWTAGTSAVRCLPCAALDGRCSACEAPTK